MSEQSSTSSGASGEPGGEALPGPLAAAAAEQPAVRTALAAALRHGPSHAYVFVGPNGSGKAAVARALAATLLPTAPKIRTTRAAALCWTRPLILI